MNPGRLGRDVQDGLGRLVRGIGEQTRATPISVIAIACASVFFGRLVVDQFMSFATPLSVFEGHNWRQAFTYSVAWNFAHETLDVLRPRMFVELAHSNVVPMEAPLLPLVSSLALRISDSIVGPRFLSWLGLAATVRVLWAWLLDPKSVAGSFAERAGMLLALGLSPMVAVDFRSLQPEAFAALLAISAAYFFARHAETNRRSDAVKGAALFGLSLLSKPLALGIAPALLLFAMWRRPPPGDGATRSEPTRKRTGLFVGGAIFLAVLPWFAWDLWAQHLLASELQGNWIIEIGHPAKDMLAMLLDGQYRAEALLHQLPNYATSWWLPPAIAAGLYRGLAEKRWRPIAVPLAVWLVGYMIEVLAVGIRLRSNAYYFILAAAPLAYFAALGLGAVVRLLDARVAPVSNTIFRSALACLVLLPMGSVFSRSSPWTNTVDVAALGFERNRNVWSSDLGLGRLLVVFLIVFALAPYLRPKRIPIWIGLFVFCVMAGLAFRPASDRSQFFRFYIADQRRAGFEAELAALRSAVDRYSNRSDRIVVSPGGTYREPPMVFFYYALRDGFAYQSSSEAELERMRQRGARLYLHVEQAEKAAPAPIPGRVLATGSWWRLSCLAQDGCER